MKHTLNISIEKEQYEKEAIKIRTLIHNLLQEKLPDYQAFITFDLLELNIIKEGR